MIERFLARFRVGEYFSSRYVPSWSVLALDTVVSVGASFFALLVLRALLPSPMLTAPRAVALLAASALFSLVSFGVFRTFRSVIRHSTLRGVWKLVAAVLLKDSLLYLFCLAVAGRWHPASEDRCRGFPARRIAYAFPAVGRAAHDAGPL